MGIVVGFWSRDIGKRQEARLDCRVKYQDIFSKLL
jgi:hypothetical protein